ncbi:MAG: hypothetical protein ACI3XN_08400 [Eubacteriales bacterium]
MKKNFGIYSIIWVICLAVFNVITFVTPNEIGGISKFSGSFWVGYIFITIAFIGQLICAFFAFKPRNFKKLFYKIPLISVSYTGLVLMLIAGSIFMAVPTLPEWIGIIACVLILAFSAIAIIKATAAAELVSGIDENVKTQTFFIKNLASDAQSLMTSAKSDELRAEAKKVYEAIRYSDPVSNIALSELNTQIERQFNAFAEAVKADDAELAKETADALLEMIEVRNQKCKVLK